MKTRIAWTVIVPLGVVCLFGLSRIMRAQSAEPGQKDVPKITAEQQEQLTRLAQLEEQLQKSRSALHAAIDEYGWDSEQADDARESLVRDRTEYRKLRRSLVAAGVSVPAPSGYRAGGPGDRPGRGGRSYGRHHARHHHGHCGCDWPGW